MVKFHSIFPNGTDEKTNSVETIPRFFIALLAAAGISLIGCGGNGSTTGVGASIPAKILSWGPPAYFTDNTALNPATDLDVFELYVRTDGYFSSNDSAMAAVIAFDSNTGQVTTTFNLAGLRPFLSEGVTYFVSVRAVAKNGLKSDFSQAATFSF